MGSCRYASREGRWYEQQAENIDWYLKASLHLVELLLTGVNEDGKYMIRLRAGFANDYILAVIYKSKPTHHLILFGEDGQYTVNKKSFGPLKTIEQVSSMVKSSTTYNSINMVI